MSTATLYTESDAENTLLATAGRDAENSKELTGYTDVGEQKVEEEIVSGHNAYKQMDNPYPDQPMKQVLSREYRVGNFSWAEGSATGFKLGSVTFPDALFARPNIQDKLTAFNYFRANVKVRVKINTTSMHRGALLISWLPFTTTTNIWNSFNIWQASMCNPQILDASMADSIEFVIPWVNPRFYLDTVRYFDGEMGTLIIWVLVPLLSNIPAGGAPMDVTVFASFEDPEVAAYTWPVGVQAAVSIAQQKKLNAMTSKYMNAMNVPRNRASELVGKIFKNQMAKPRRENNDKGKEKDESSRLLKMLTKGVGDIDLQASIEQETKNQTGDDNILSVGALTSALSKVSVRTADSLFSSLANHVSDMVGSAVMALNKPENMSLSTYIFNIPNRDMPSGKGSDNSVKLSLDPAANLDVKSNFVDPAMVNPTLLSLAMRPSLVATLSFDSSKLQNQLIARLGVDPGAVRVYVSGTSYHINSWLSHITNFFKYWRGGIKYRIHFFCSKFVTARVRIGHNMTGANPPLNDWENFGGDYPSIVVDIKGSTIVDFTIPFIYSMPYVEYTGTIDIDNATGPLGSSIDITVINHAASQDVSGDTTIVGTVWAAAAEDFSWSQYCSYWCPPSWTVQGDTNKPGPLSIAKRTAMEHKERSIRELRKELKNGEIDYQGLIEDFQVSFPGLVNAKLSTEVGNVRPEAFNALMDLFHRYQDYGTPANEIFVVPWTSSTVQHPNLDVMRRAFLFWRGSLKYRLISTTAGQNSMYLDPAFGGADRGRDISSNGFVTVDSAFSKTVSATCPYYCPAIMLPTGGEDNTSWVYNPYNSAATPPFDYTNQMIQSKDLEQVYMAAGEDFSLIYPACPPYFSLGV